jgi:hypothetical protein
MQRPAKPFRPVRLRLAPPGFKRKSPDLSGLFLCPRHFHLAEWRSFQTEPWKQLPDTVTDLGRPTCRESARDKKRPPDGGLSFALMDPEIEVRYRAGSGERNSVPRHGRPLLASTFCLREEKAFCAERQCQVRNKFDCRVDVSSFGLLVGRVLFEFLVVAPAEYGLRQSRRESERSPRWTTWSKLPKQGCPNVPWVFIAGRMAFAAFCHP